MPRELQVDERHQQRERDEHRHDERRAQVEQEDEEHEGDQQPALEQVVADGVQRRAHQLGAVVERIDRGLVVGEAQVHLLDRRSQPRQHRRGVLAASHEHDALDRVVVGAPADHALARRPALLDGRHVLQEHGRAVVGGDAHRAQVVERLEQPLAADDELLGAALEHAAAGVHRSGADRLLQVGEREAVARQAKRVGHDVDLAHQAAVADDVGDAVDAHQRGPHHPVLQRAQLHRVVLRAAQAVAVDLADRRGERPELGRHAVRQIGVAQALEHLLARPLAVDAVVERERDGRQAEERQVAEAGETRRAVQRALDGKPDLTLDLLGGLPREHGDDVHLRVGRVGKRLDGQRAEREPPPRGDHQREEEYRGAVAQREGDEAIEHGTLSWRDRSGSAAGWRPSRRTGCRARARPGAPPRRRGAGRR